MSSNAELPSEITRDSRFRRFVAAIRRPLFLFLTGIALAGVAVQIFWPDFYFAHQEDLRRWVMAYEPYDKAVFVALQVAQVIFTPISHYTVSILGGALYGQWLGGVLNWIGRVIGHIAAYWIGRTLGQRIISFLFSQDDVVRYGRFVSGTPRTLHIRLGVLFLMIFLPLFPDDELSYLVGLGGLPFLPYLGVLALGHLGGSFALAYVGAGIDSKDPYFWFLTVLTFVLTATLIWGVRRLGRLRAQEASEQSGSTNLRNDTP